MIVYNNTIKVEWPIVEEWLTWQLETHIPEVMFTGLFDDFKIYRLLEQDDSEGPTFVIQYFTSKEENYSRYISEFEMLLQQKAFEKWRNQFVSYSTSMKLVS